MNNFFPGHSETNRILIVDDEQMIVDLLTNTLKKKGYDCSFAENGKKALAKLDLRSFDVVVTDIDMPVMDGIELVKKMRKSNYLANIIVMTGQIRSYRYDEIVSLGASDFVEKPFSPREMELRIDRVLKERRLKLIADRAHENLKESCIDSIHRLVMAAEFKDEDTGDHIVRIGRYCPLIAEKLYLSQEFIETIKYAAPMHDIGKIGIPDNILLKAGKLTGIEFEIIKTHTQIGARLLSRSKSKILQMAEEIALTHHEKFNGKGYPRKLKGKDIPVAGRIVAIADTFDALTSRRPYKEPYPLEIALEIIKKERGAHFDPDIVDIFVRYFNDIVKIRGAVDIFQGASVQDYILSERDKVEKSTISSTE